VTRRLKKSGQFGLHQRAYASRLCHTATFLTSIIHAGDQLCSSSSKATQGWTCASVDMPIACLHYELPKLGVSSAASCMSSETQSRLALEAWAAPSGCMCTLSCSHGHAGVRDPRAFICPGSGYRFDSALLRLAKNRCVVCRKYKRRARNSPRLPRCSECPSHSSDLSFPSQRSTCHAALYMSLTSRIKNQNKESE
jgi:hypothetical protein